MHEMKLGETFGCGVYLPDDAANQHVMLDGMSGTGKSVKLQMLELQLAQRGQSELVFNYHGTHDESQIFEPIRDIYRGLRRDIDVYEDGIGFDILAPMCFANGRMESRDEVVGGVVSAFSSVLKLGIQQQIILRRAGESAAANHLFFNSNMAAIKAGLNVDNNAAAEAVLERFNVLFCRPIFTKTGKQPHPGKINICNLSRFDSQMQFVVTELILSYIRRRALQIPYSDTRGLYVVLDEVQNLNLSTNSMFSFLMREGRKYNISVIAATQTLEGFNRAQKELFNQAATRLYFRQSGKAALQVARGLNLDKTGVWKKTLQNLEVGACVAVGELTVNGSKWNKPLILDRV